jgi:hypothetical protein
VESDVEPGFRLLAEALVSRRKSAEWACWGFATNASQTAKPVVMKSHALERDLHVLSAVVSTETVRGIVMQPLLATQSA